MVMVKGPTMIITISDCGFFHIYRDMPIKGTPPNKGAPYGLGATIPVHSNQNTLNFLNNWPIFNPKPPLESLEAQLSLHDIIFNLAITPCAFIRHITVHQSFLKAAVSVDALCHFRWYFISFSGHIFILSFGPDAGGWSFYQLGPSRRGGLFSFHCFVFSFSFSLRSWKVFPAPSMEMYYHKPPNHTKLGGAANFCLQKFLTGLVYLVLILL